MKETHSVNGAKVSRQIRSDSPGLIALLNYDSQQFEQNIALAKTKTVQSLPSVNKRNAKLRNEFREDEFQKLPHSRPNDDVGTVRTVDYFFFADFFLAVFFLVLFFLTDFFFEVFFFAPFSPKMLSHPETNFLDAPVWTV